MKKLFTFCLLISASLCFSFYSTKGTTILDNNNQPTQLKSLTISLFKDSKLTDLTEADYKLIKSLKFNTVNFSMILSEIDKDKNVIPDPKVITWLKKNSALAKQANLGVILSMSEQDIETNKSSSISFWGDFRTQSSFVRIWSFISKAFATDQNVIGYNIVPNFEMGINAQKYIFSLKSITTTIRTIDPKHILFINGAELLIQNKDLKFPVKENVVLLYSMFDPIEFTQQKTPWAISKSADKYPNFKEVSFPTDLVVYKKSTGDSTYFTGSRDMSNYQGDKYLINDTNIVAAVPVFEASNLGTQGEVIFQSVIVSEYSQGSDISKQIVSIDPTVVKKPRFIAEGKTAQYKVLFDYTFDQRDVFRINSTEGNSLLYLDDQRFVARQGYVYAISGFLKPSMTNFDAKVRLSIYFLKSLSGMKPVARDKQLLLNITKSYIKLAREINMPIMVGQTGIYNTALKSNGPEEYVLDLFNTFDENNISYSFLSYNGSGYGLFKAGLYKGKQAKTQSVIISKMK